jgi:hypothetical protein
MTQKKKKAGQTGIESNQELRTLRFEIRLSPAEYTSLTTQALLAEDNSLAQYARNKLLHGGSIATQQLREERATSKALMAELARIGNNVNQIARALNSDDAVSMAMLEELCKVETTLANLHSLGNLTILDTSYRNNHPSAQVQP